MTWKSLCFTEIWSWHIKFWQRLHDGESAAHSTRQRTPEDNESKSLQWLFFYKHRGRSLGVWDSMRWMWNIRRCVIRNPGHQEQDLWSVCKCLFCTVWSCIECVLLCWVFARDHVSVWKIMGLYIKGPSHNMKEGQIFITFSEV